LINPDCYEKLTSDVLSSDGKNTTLKVTGLEKQYEDGFKAVNGINVQMFSDQIFCLLGHNGAGKTSTISMLTGLINNTKGAANLFGLDMFSQMDEARKTMGVCPQHDVLFDMLTPEEHLNIFYEFKGASGANKKKEVATLLHDIGLDDKKDAQAQTLSGGNKRKLSVAIALCGNSKFVLLDEPTSGLDIQARRQLWNMLRQYKKNRIILLTTHYMDEADILGDRIGIMNQGKMTCLGSSMFLKSRFGVGYVMTVVKNSPAPNYKIMKYMKERLGPDVQKVTEIQGEMTLQFPREYQALFKDFFTDFDNDL
jgi:ATP-binding cassette subfamily A (ABC1) protein 3